MTTIASLVENFVAKRKETPENMRGDLSALKLVPHLLDAEECQFFINLVSPQSAEKVQQYQTENV